MSICIVYRFWFHSLLILRNFFKWLKKNIYSTFFSFIYIVFNLFRFFKYLRRKHFFFFFNQKEAKLRFALVLVITYYIKLLFVENIVYSVKLCSDWLTCKRTVAILFKEVLIFFFFFFWQKPYSINLLLLLYMHKKGPINRHALSYFVFFFFIVSEKINQHASFFALTKTNLFMLLINLLRLKLEYKLVFFL